MGVTLRAAVEAGRAAWLANLTIAEKAWPVRQLYTLYRMLLENREDLLEVCNRDFSHEPIFWEREFASLVEDIGALILSLEAPTTPAIGKSHFGTFTTSLRPRGVSLILSTSKNPLRFVLAPLAASIAARNVVILGTTRLDKFWGLIEQKVLTHLDTFAIQVVVATLSDISPEHFDQIYIIAEDEDREKYSELIKLPHVSWHQASGAFKVAVVDGGPLNVSSCASEISTKHDQLTSVIVQDEHFNSLCDAICKCMVNAGSNTKTLSLDLPKCRRLTSIFYTMDWMGSATQSSTPDLHFLLQTAQRAGAVLLLKSSSLEQCLDSLCQMSNIAQATLLNPRSKEHERYFQDWARSTVVAFRSIPSSVPEGEDDILNLPLSTYICEGILMRRQ
ncbi:hypothetical protein H2204_013685 [Knufia peltigerae]|uniref:Uncharacterized protein n=1 Tax=Knufia peltigerae TaxID=1002370 RepID=A0AA38XR38_9EURO|nr:hypothetical protein H2204_013685 [Knufia peltigerae]